MKAEDQLKYLELLQSMAGMQPTEAPADPVDLCMLPECSEPASSPLGFCDRHQKNYESWQR